MQCTLYILKSWDINFKTFLFFGFIGFSVFSFGQNKAKNIFSSNNISEIIIDGDQIFSIKVTTEKSETITINSVSDGDYGNDYQVISKVKDKQLFVALNRISVEKIPDDKRNAHKVVAAALEIKIPESLNLSVKSDVGSVEAKGRFNEIKFNLLQGGCTIDGTAQLATIKTVDGNIFVRTKNAIIQTDSHHGLVDFPSDMLGFNVWRLTTNGGNITVKKIEQ
ncbi:MAG: hypothetical protein HKP48_06545 [Winogradskyella sp.]|uniref:hypothetical protein n=1 Tax=Winogradskyella sp. TaxID=1883156 RepID=UPI001824D5DD|nr:hypothetical protein [Winogradskyella sp.]MBT8245399.1 hypothetical protein [Winogradskyella sp.]NNK22948.1 hypothetical protein [Winogradskyella sp.]